MPKLNQLTGAISSGLSGVVSIVNNTTSLVPELAENLVSSIVNVGTLVIELVQTVNVGLETAPSLISLKEIIAIVDGIVASLFDGVSKLLENVISVVESRATNPTTTAAKAIASIQLVLQSILKIVAEVLVSVDRLLSQITSATSAVLSTVMSTISQALSNVDKMVAQLSSNASTAIKGIVSFLKETSVPLSSAVSKLVVSAGETLASAVGTAIGIASDSTASVSTLDIDDAFKGILADVASVLYGVFNNIETAVKCVASSKSNVIGVVDKAVSTVGNRIGEILAIIASLTAESCRDAGSVDGIADQINLAISNLIASVQGVVTAILSVGTGDLNAEVAAILEHVVCAVIALVHCVVAAVADLLEVIVASINNIADKLSAIISGALNNILSNINGLYLDKILNGLSKSVSALGGNIPASFGALSAVLGSDFGVVGSFSGSLDGILGDLCSLKGTAGKISAVMSQLDETVDGVVEGLVGHLSGIGAQAATAISLLNINVVAVTQTLAAVLSASSKIGIC